MTSTPDDLPPMQRELAPHTFAMLLLVPRLAEFGELLRMDVAAGVGAVGLAGTARLLRGQAELIRENVGLLAQLGENYDRQAAVLERYA